MKTTLLALIILVGCATAAEAKKRYHCRDAMTGFYVTAAWAKAHPRTTVCHRIR